MSPSPSTDAATPSSPTSIPNALFLQPKASPTMPIPDGSLQTSPEPSPSSSTSPYPSPGPSLDDAGPIWLPDADVAPTDRPAASSSTPSTGDNPVSKAGLKVVLGQAVKTITNAVAAIAADAGEREFGLWRVDDEDVEAISAPAAKLIYRRLPDEAKGSDTLDLFTLGLALAGYLAKNFHKKAGIRQLLQGGPDVPAPAAPAGP